MELHRTSMMMGSFASGALFIATITLLLYGSILMGVLLLLLTLIYATVAIFHYIESLQTNNKEKGK